MAHELMYVPAGSAGAANVQLGAAGELPAGVECSGVGVVIF